MYLQIKAPGFFYNSALTNILPAYKIPLCFQSSCYPDWMCSW